MFDFLLVMLPLFPRKLNAVTAQKYFLYSPMHKLLPIMGCIPKNMFDPDIRSIVGIKTVLNRGDGVLLFPEGRCSSSHAYVGMHKSTGKLIKKCGVPVFSCYMEGAHISLPHWRKGIRLGRIRVSYRNLFTENDIKALSIEEINTAIDARLSGFEGAPPVKKPFETLRARRLAEGLDMLLYYCPKCEREFSMVSEGNTIKCNVCGNNATMNRNGKLTPSEGSIMQEDISMWYRDQVRHEMQSISEDMEPIVEQVKVRIPTSKPGGGMVESGFGTMQLDSKGWRFSGEISGQQVNLFFPVETVPAISYDHCDNFQFYSGGKYYKFAPEDLRKCIKYMILTECVYWKFSERIMMTPGVNSGFVN